MKPGDFKTRTRPSAAARAEAAAWLTRLHGPNRTRDVEAGLRRWMAEDPERAAAFELLTDTWEKSARLRRSPADRATHWHRIGVRMNPLRAVAAAAAVAVLSILGTLYFFHQSGVRTGIGEQHTLVLDDGSRIYLNTSTRVAVEYGEQQRRVVLEAGEALFEVARFPDRPFVVVAGDRQVTALGTAFIVRRDGGRLAVTLMEGKVSISPAEVDLAVAPPQDIRILSPGERLTIAGARPAKVDRPPINEVTAWRRGQVALDNTRLGDAVAEMNRYSHIPIVIESTQAADIPVSGIFRAGASADFAQAVARTYGLRVSESQTRIVLSGAPAATASTPHGVH